MKRFLLCLLLLFCFFIPQIVLASTTSEPVIFTWEDNNMNKSQDEGYGWKIYQRKSGNNYDYNLPMLTLLYIDGETVCQTSRTIEIAGDPGSSVTYYWVCRAFNNMFQSADSNEVHRTFIIPQDGGLILPIDFMIMTSIPNASINIELEAEAGTVSPIMEIGDNCIQVPGTGYMYESNAAVGSLVLTFNSQITGNYLLWARISTPDGESDNSCYVKINDQSPILWDMSIFTDGYGWDQFSNIVGLNEGENTITIFPREDGLKLDKFIVTNDMEYIPQD